jgi:hypothetical protein
VKSATRVATITTGFALGIASGRAPAQSDFELARQLANPIPAVASVQVQYNLDREMGADGEGRKDYLNILPAIPIRLNADWTAISKTYTALTRQTNVGADGGTHTGLQYIVQAFFFSPSRPAASGVVWGAGPIVQLPVASDDALGYRKLGIGPTGFVARHDGPWTYGVLADHLSSVAGQKDRPEFSSTFFQPWVSYTTRDAWTYTLNAESIYDWKGTQWSIPVQFLASKLTRLGDERIEIGGGLRYWADSPDGAAKGWGLRLFVTWVLPKS